MKRCKKLVLDSSYPNINFDEKGICSNYYDFYNNVKPFWKPNNEGLKIVEKTVNQIKKDSAGSEFDCILGLSGGGDSSYMLHVMVNDFGLKPLVFHVDGGWNSEISSNNINVLVDKLNLDLFTEVIDWQEMKNFQLSMFKSGVPHIDTPQDMSFVGVLYKFAEKYNIKWILNGGNISTECVMTPLKYFYYATDMRQINDILQKFSNYPMNNFPFSSVFYHKIWLKFFKGLKVFKPLNYMPYLKDEAMTFLKNKYGFKPYPQKHFESRFTRFFEGYWLYTRFGFDIRTVQFSSLILTDQMTRKDAINQLNKSPFEENSINNEIEYVANKLDISVSELDKYHKMKKYYYSDYKNLNNIFMVGEFIMSKFLKTRRGGAF